MAIRKLKTGQWQADIQPGGRGAPRTRRNFDTRGEAERWQRWALTQAQEKPWQPATDDPRKLSDLIAEWQTAIGHTLADAANRLGNLQRLCTRLDDPRAAKITPQNITSHRAARLSGGTKPATVNREIAYLRSMFNGLTRLGSWSADNPCAAVRRVKEPPNELTYLTAEQIAALLAQLDRVGTDARHVARICLATGARWGEAETLRASNVRPGLVTFVQTKSNRSRSVPVEQSILDALPKPNAAGQLFTPCYNSFRDALLRADITLPPGQLTHVLRHTFASVFMQRGGNILTLKNILGHASIAMTMRYAHLSPNHLKEALTLNPLANLSQTNPNKN